MRPFLVVDDDPTITSLYEILIKARYRDAEVIKAHNGNEALDLAKKKRLSIIISDVDMPVMNGIELHRAIKRLSAKLAGKMTFITGESSLRYIKDEGVPCLGKPFSKKDFYGMVERVLGLGMIKGCSKLRSKSK